MKEYPSIDRISKLDDVLGKIGTAFEKMDGSNMRFGWNKKRGFYKFGTRRRLFDEKDPEYGEAISLFLNKYGEPLSKIFHDKYKKFDSAIAFAEFVGPYSIAGKHDDTFLIQNGLMPSDQTNTKDVVLFDVNINKKGFIPSSEFIDLFSHVHIPEIVYQGELTQDFIDQIRNHPTMGEGVVFKGGVSHDMWYRKIKTLSYLEKIKKVFGTGWESYWE